MLQLKITGLGDVKASLKALPPHLSNKIIQRALVAALRPMARQAKRNAPRLTGRLRRSIVVRRSKIHKPGTKMIGAYVTARRGAKRDDPRGAYYAGMVEAGHRTRGGSVVQGQRYMARAYQQQRQTCLRLGIALLEAGVRAAARSLRLRAH